MKTNKGFVVPFLALIVLLALGAGYYFVHKDSYSSGPTVASSTSSDINPSIPVESSTILPYGQVKLHLNETAKFKNVSITPTKVVEDSRCPKGVYCIQAGTVRIELSVASDLGSNLSTLQLGKSLTPETSKITLVSVDPIKSTTQTSSGDYVFTLTVEKPQ